MSAPSDALERLIDGNRRYVEGSTQGPRLTEREFAALAEAQAPFATVLGCSDSRVPPEIVFDQRPGDLFVIRIAGNIATPEAIGSAEFAVTALGTPLIVVLGHSGCGAVGAALERVARSDHDLPPHLAKIVDAIVPAAEQAAHDADGDDERWMRGAIRRNVDANVARFFASDVLAGQIERGQLSVVGATYDLERGDVDFHGTTPA